MLYDVIDTANWHRQNLLSGADGGGEHGGSRPTLAGILSAADVSLGALSEGDRGASNVAAQTASKWLECVPCNLTGWSTSP